MHHNVRKDIELLVARYTYAEASVYRTTSNSVSWQTPCCAIKMFVRPYWWVYPTCVGLVFKIPFVEAADAFGELYAMVPAEGVELGDVA